jgi:hypothetical protein
MRRLCHQVLASPIIPRIVGGDRTLYANADVVLVSESIDPDRIDTPFLHIWRCAVVDEPDAPCFRIGEAPASLYRDNPSVLIPAGALAPRMYRFELEVAKAPLNAGRQVP